MAYRARRSDDDVDQEARNAENNASNIRNAANVAVASGNPYAAAAGGAVKLGDALTGGKVSDDLGKATAKATNRVPGGEDLQNKLNSLNESGLGDEASKAANFYSDINNSNNTAGSASDDDRINTGGNNSKGSLKANNGSLDNGNSDNDFDGSLEGEGQTKVSPIAKTILLMLAPVIFIIIIVFFIIFSTVSIFFDFEDAIGASYFSGEGVGGFTDFNAINKEEEEFYKRINEVKQELAEEGKTVEAVNIVAVYHIMAYEDKKYTYEKMTKREIREIADLMFKDDEYDVAVFEKNLIHSYFRKKFPFYSEKRLEKMADDTIKYVNDYKDLIGDYSSSSDVSSNSCTYQISGFYYPSTKGNYYLKNTLEFKDLNVRLMQTGSSNGHDYGGNFGSAIEGEDLIPFEDYVMGVVYFDLDNSTPDEAVKAKLVAVRSYALARANDSNNGHKLEMEGNNNWVMQLSNSSYDQAFCNPELGCSTNDINWKDVHSGVKSGIYTKPPLASDARLRSIASGVRGEVLTNSDGNIIATKHTGDTYKKFIELANKGYDYKQILLEVYNSSGGATDIKKMRCGSCVSTGEFASWKQYEGPWVNIKLGSSGKSIKQIGCAATSVAMLIAKSGVETTVSLNPGTFVQTLNSHNGFGSGNCLGCINWSAASYVAPRFKLGGIINLEGLSKEEKFAKINELFSSGYYITAEVMGQTGEHWVALDAIQGGNIIMMDPGSTNTNLWATYPWVNTSRLVFYRAL